MIAAHSLFVVRIFNEFSSSLSLLPLPSPELPRDKCVYTMKNEDVGTVSAKAVTVSIFNEVHGLLVHHIGWGDLV